jgi:DNA-directed RNA polymerase I, II, and III subunit RPABC2
LVVKRFTKKTASKKSSKTKGKVEEEEVRKSNRPADEVVTYAESEFELREVEAQGSKVVIGLPWLTRFERARITGARALQLSLGAPPLIKGSEEAKTSILLAMEEVEQKALPISIRRVLPNGLYQDIPIDWMK